MHGIAATNFGANRLDVFWPDSNFQMLQRTWDGTQWLGWYELGGVFTPVPAAVASMAMPPQVLHSVEHSQATFMGSAGASGTSAGAGSGAGMGAGTSMDSGSALPGASRCAAGTGSGIGAIAGQIRIDVTVSLATLLGLDEDPGQLAGYGAVTAQTARRLAANGTWRRLVTDLQTGTVLDVGKTRYRPPEDLAEIIRARDPYCVSPICNTASRSCDLDHRVPFNPDGTGGATSTENISPACRRDHLLKTHAGRTYDRADNGTITWTTPTGHTYAYNSPLPPGHEHLPQVEPEPGLDLEPKATPKVKPEQKSEADDPPPF